jgi:hypothetical protein
LPQLIEAGAGELWQQDALIDAELSTTIHGAGFRLIAWTVDDPARMRMLIDLGIDGLCTNKPDLARSVVGPPTTQPRAQARGAEEQASGSEEPGTPGQPRAPARGHDEPTPVTETVRAGKRQLG